MCVCVHVCYLFTIVLTQMARKHVVLFSYTCFYTDLSVPPCILLTHCSFTLPPLYICAGMYSMSTLVVAVGGWSGWACVCLCV